MPETSEQRAESSDKQPHVNTVRVIRKDVKKMNNKFDHLGTSVRQLKPDCKIFKDQSAHLTKQVNELKSSVSKLESQNRGQELIFAPLLL